MKKDKRPFLLKMVRWFYPKVEALAPGLAHRYFVKIFFTPLRYRVGEKEKALSGDAATFTLRAAGKKIQCYAWGKGPVILLVHGWAGRGTQFRKIIETFSERGYKVVGFDGPAHGRSEGKRTNIFEFEDTLKEIYRSVGEPEAIIAHSFGGSAVLFAAMNGLPVKKLINIASPTIGDEIINTYLRAIGGSPKTAVFFRRYMEKQFGKSFDEFTSLHFITRLRHNIDLLLIHDEDDQEVIPRHARELVKLYPQAKLIITRKLGHTRILKDPGVIEACATFIREGHSVRKSDRLA